MNVRLITICGVLIAFSIVLSRFASFRLTIAGVENIRFGLGTLPIMLAGILFGPLIGGLVGIISDVLGFVISPKGIYMPQFTFVSMMYGFFPGLFCFPFQIKAFQTKFVYRLRVYVGILLGQIIPQWLFLPYYLHILFQIPYKLSLFPRLITTSIQFLICLLLLTALLKIVKET